MGHEFNKLGHELRGGLLAQGPVAEVWPAHEVLRPESLVPDMLIMGILGPESLVPDMSWVHIGTGVSSTTVDMLIIS